MKVNYSARRLGSAAEAQDGVWQEAAAATLAMKRHAAAMQPTAAIRNTWEKQPIGATSKVEVARAGTTARRWRSS